MAEYGSASFPLPEAAERRRAARRMSATRRLALTRVRELRAAGLSYREIGSHDRPEREASAPPATDAPRAVRTEARAQGYAVFEGSGSLVLLRLPAVLFPVQPRWERRLRDVVERFAAPFCALLRLQAAPSNPAVEEVACKQVRVGSDRLYLRATFVGGGTLGPGTLLISLELLSPPLFDDNALRLRFGLTQQEVRVAWLLADGRSNAEIAAALAIRASTARRHTERVFAKLEVHSRAAVGAKLSRLSSGMRQVVGDATLAPHAPRPGTERRLCVIR